MLTRRNIVGLQAYVSFFTKFAIHPSLEHLNVCKIFEEVSEAHRF